MESKPSFVKGFWEIEIALSKKVVNSVNLCKYLKVSQMKHLLITALLLIPFFSFSQDKLFFKTGKTIEAKVTEIGPVEVKYITPNQDRELVISVFRADLLRIEFENGDRLVMIDDIVNPDVYIGQRSQAIKIGFFSPLADFTSISYERMIKPGISWEASTTLIGLGRNVDNRDPSGLGITYGFRFTKLPDFNTGNLRYHHVLQGSYVKPEFAFSRYSESYYDWNDVRTKATVTYAVLSFVAGQQWVFQDIILADVYAGAGYGLVDNDGSESSQDENRRYGYVQTQGTYKVWLTGGFKVGFLIK